MALRLRIDGAAPESSSRTIERESYTDKLNGDTKLSPTSTSSGKHQVDSINEGIAETAVQAAAAVLTLREREQELLEQSKNRAYGDETLARQEEAAEIETEIERIADNATYNGVNVLSGKTLTLDSTAAGIHDAIGLASFQSELSTSARFSNQTPGNATADLEVLKDAVQSAASLLVSYEGASEAAKSSGERSEVSFDTPVPDTIRDGDQAQELARKIAATVVSPYATEKQRASLIEMSSAALEEDTVYRLIA